MRISDWSSDVCSSDLPRASNDIGIAAFQSPLRSCLLVSIKKGHVERARRFRFAFQFGKPDRSNIVSRQCTFRAPQRTSEGGGAFATMRSEEHTSELQSLMRISYAVFCLKKKN